MRWGSVIHDIEKIYEEHKKGNPIGKLIAVTVLLWLFYYGKDIWGYISGLLE